MRSIFFIFSLIMFFSCDTLQDDFDIEIPENKDQLVVEMYIEPYLPVFRATVSRSSNYLDDPEPDYVENATVSLKRNRRNYPLRHTPFFDPETGKYYNYIYDFGGSNVIFPNIYDIYELSVKDRLGNTVTGESSFLPIIPVDSIWYDYNEDEEPLLSVSFSFFDDPNEEDYYRVTMHRNGIDATPGFILYLDDKSLKSERVVLSSPYLKFDPGDEAIVSVYHLHEDYFNYVVSTNRAVQANYTPLFEPSEIKSNVEGGIGVFTCISYDRKSIQIQAPPRNTWPFF